MAATLPTVLLVVDLQECLVNGSPEEGPRSTPALASNVGAILSRWRDLKRPVIHIHHHPSDTTDPLHPSHPETSAAHRSAAPLPDEPVFSKCEGSAFVGTPLLENLQTLSPSGEKVKLVIMGMDGAQCVNNTTRNAADLGFDVTVVADASASYGMRDWRRGEGKGKGWGPDETHDAAMAMLAGMYARVWTTKELLESLK